MEVIYESNQPKQKRFSIGQTTSGHKISGISSGIDSELHSNDSYFWYFCFTPLFSVFFNQDHFLYLDLLFEYLGQLIIINQF